MSAMPIRRSQRNTRNRSRDVRQGARRRLLRGLLAEKLERRLMLTAITSLDPAANTIGAPATSDISATFDQPINASTATHDSFVVFRESIGKVDAATGTIGTDGQTVSVDPSTPLWPGEIVRVTATDDIQSTGGEANTPHVWEFRTEVTSGSGVFVDSGQRLGTNQDGEIGFGDLDADGDLDAVQGGNIVWLNDGAGNFSDSGQRLGGVNWDLADLDGDGDLDIAEQNNVYLNDGNAVFAGTGQDLTPSGGAAAVELGDIDGDGDVDAVIGINYAGNLVWKNNGSGSFSNTGQSLGTAASQGIGLGDFDNDGDLDAYVANNGPPNRVYFNDGTGIFTDSTQALGGFQASVAVDVADVDNDGDLDAVVSNSAGGQGTRVWLNDGNGIFVETGQQLNAGTTNNDVSLGDIDGDGDLDAYIPGWYNAAEVWTNDGSGIFAESQSLPFPGQRSGWVGFGDVDGDGDLDAFEGNRFAEGARIMINQNLQPSVSLSIDNATIDEAAGVATVTAALSAAHTAAVTVDLGFSGSATVTDDYTTSSAQIVIPVGATTGSIAITAVDDAVDEPDETVIVDVAGTTNADEVGTQQVTTTILDNDELVVPAVTLSVDNDTIAEAGGVAAFTATLSQATTVDVTVDLELTGTATPGDDYNASGTQIVIAAGATTGSVTVTAVQDELEEADETIIADISAVTNGTEAGTQQGTTTIEDDDEPAGMSVTALTPTRAGFQISFTNDLDSTDLNLYDSQTASLGAADVTLTGASSGPVAGALIVSDRLVEFVKTGGPLSPDTYTVTLRSAADGFEDTGGLLLDGNGDGTAGDDYTSTFEVAEAAANTVTIGIPDFVRGPGQEVNLPADTATGIPLTISEGNNVRAIDARISYDPELLDISAATVGPDAPAGASVILNNSTPGLAILVYFSSTPLPAGAATVINLTASVPTANASANYRTQQVLDIHDVVISDGNDTESPVIEDDAVHVATFFSDVSANGRVNAADAAQVARIAALLDTGFANTPLSDPGILADVSGNGRVNAADASLVAQFAALISVPQIPAIPLGVQVGGIYLPQPENESSGPGERVAAPSLLEFEDYSDVGMADTEVEILAGDREAASEDLVLEDLLDEVFGAW